MIQHHVFFSGIVQGVGFRYTVYNRARELSLNGWVRNLSDGRVELMVEGEEDTIQALMDTIDSHYQGYIKQKFNTTHPATGQFQDFQIVH